VHHQFRGLLRIAFLDANDAVAIRRCLELRAVDLLGEDLQDARALVLIDESGDLST
jgi:hypothetical protein